jgi:hypothetical protein
MQQGVFVVRGARAGMELLVQLMRVRMWGVLNKGKQLGGAVLVAPFVSSRGSSY